VLLKLEKKLSHLQYTKSRIPLR